MRGGLLRACTVRKKIDSLSRSRLRVLAAARSFEPFFTTKPDGLGLGLCVSRAIIEAHGGRIDLCTTGGPGTTFRFTLREVRSDHRPSSVSVSPQPLSSASDRR